VRLKVALEAPPMPSAPYIFDGPHWHLQPPENLDAFFGALPLLVPSGGTLALADGLFFDLARARMAPFLLTAPPESLARLPSEFRRADLVRLSPGGILVLQELAQEYNTAALFLFLCLFTEDHSVLEWFDAPGDPISIASTLPQDVVKAFARAIGAPSPLGP
jgi:hypothetical protein